MNLHMRSWQGSLLAAGLFQIAAQSQAAHAATETLSCSSTKGEKQHCPANTSAGILLSRSTGTVPCLLGRNWGYDDQGVWVQDGCGADFVVATTAPVSPVAPVTAAAAQDPMNRPEAPEPFNETYGYLDPGEGFLIGKTEHGEMSISGYGLLRYINQIDDDKVYTDHLGRERPVDGRQDIYSHRVLVWLDGWLGNPKFRYTITFWTVNTTDQDAIIANVGYQFNRKFNLYAGIFGNMGTRSLQGSHPYWLGHDRVMADEFFRPYFTQGVFANGEILPGLWYGAAVGNTSSTLGTTAVQLDRNFTYSGSMWWMPTTHEFGPRGAYGDWEGHEELATRFGFSAADSPEQRYTDIDTASGNTVVKLADGVNVFETGALTPGVTVTQVNYRDLAVDMGMKYRGFFLQAEFYYRWLNDFIADGPLPTDEIEDWGFYVQGAFFAIPKKLEIYGATSQIFGDKSSGFDDSSEYILGMNYYPFNSRNHRLNFQYNRVDKSPVGSTFGYYVAGQEGDTFSLAASFFF